MTVACLCVIKSYYSPGIDMVQEKFMGAGPQDNESAIEQAKDEQMSDFIRGKVFGSPFGAKTVTDTSSTQYKSSTGNEFPIADKE